MFIDSVQSIKKGVPHNQWCKKLCIPMSQIIFFSLIVREQAVFATACKWSSSASMCLFSQLCSPGHWGWWRHSSHMGRFNPGAPQVRILIFDWMWSCVCVVLFFSFSFFFVLIFLFSFLYLSFLFSSYVL